MEEEKKSPTGTHQGQDPDKGPHITIIGNGNIIGDYNISKTQGGPHPQGDRVDSPKEGSRALPERIAIPRKPKGKIKIWGSLFVAAGLLGMLYLLGWGKIELATWMKLPGFASPSSCHPAITITRPATTEDVTAYRQAGSIAYWIEVEGTATLCDDPAKWSILFVSSTTAPKCVEVTQVSLETMADEHWQAQVPVLDTTSSGIQVFDPPLPVTLTGYLISTQEIKELSITSRCYPSAESAGINPTWIKEAIFVTHSLSLIELKDQKD